MSDVKHGSLRTGQYLGEISALCFLKLPTQISSLPYLLVGMGSEIIIYNLGTGKEIRSFHVFEGIRVHGISCISVTGSVTNLQTSVCTFMIAVYGEKKVKLFMLRCQPVSGLENEGNITADLVVYQLLPKFRHWVLDVSFLKDCARSLNEYNHNVAVGCSDNSVLIWDTTSSRVMLEVKSPDVCLLYSMRLWGDELKDLHIASGTIFNEIIVWKVECSPTSLISSVFKGTDKINPLDKEYLQFNAVHICKLSGHEGSIFRLTWSLDGSKLVSVSDDRCARIWHFPDGMKMRSFENGVQVHNTVLYGHTARVWDCCLSESLIVTAGEDCSCRVWDLNGVQLKIIKEHIGRGIWRCLYDPNSSLLITAGFDSSLKIHHLNASSFQDRDLHSEPSDKPAVYSLLTPNSSGLSGHMNSKSEYVRCLRFTNEDTLYVATNNGFLFKANISEFGDAKWTELSHLSKDAPIICLDVLSSYSLEPTCGIQDWIAIGDGKGNMTIVTVSGDDNKVDIPFTWSAESERQLLGTFWSKSLGKRYIFTSDPKGTLKLWKLNTDSPTIRHGFIAEFQSRFGTRIICVDASVEAQVVVCGDLRGNLILFPLSEDLFSSSRVEAQLRIPPLSYFKGVHGISSVASITVSCLSSNQSEIRSTGGDGCICYLQYDAVLNNLEFIGLKQVKELSLIQSVSLDANCADDLSGGGHAIGFSSGNFIIWNLMTDTKIADISCGGWRRPFSYFLGDVPELAHCFAFVKDETIHVHKYWVSVSHRATIPNSLHNQFHGREIHSLCFVSDDSNRHSIATSSCVGRSSYVASGSEDGTVRLSRYTSGAWLESKSLGEHVGGSAVRSIFPVSDVYSVELDEADLQRQSIAPPTVSADAENPFLLISVGAKRVLTTWLLRKRNAHNKTEQVSTVDPCSMTFQWLSSDMPARKAKPQSKNLINGSGLCVTKDGKNSESVYKKEELETNSVLVDSEDVKSYAEDAFENDFRYMAVTAFLVKVFQSRSTVCFVIVACSDGSLAMRALVLPQRLWFDVSEFVPVSSPVLALQHVVAPSSIGDRYILISGSTNGNITFWDLTESVHSFMRWMSSIQIEKSIEGQKRPRTGRGSQGGRWWKSMSSSPTRKEPENGPDDSTTKNGSKEHHASLPNVADTVVIKRKADKKAVSFQILKVRPLHVVNLAHQSGVNCLHVAKTRNSSNSGSQYIILSGGDDQALHSLIFNVDLLPTNLDITTNRQNEQSRIRCLCQDKIASAHSSAVKGVWSDGKWAFSTGLDQRVRCWYINDSGNLHEQAHLVISVPEPETLSARAYDKDQYEITVAGRGMQMVKFDALISPAMEGNKSNRVGSCNSDHNDSR